MFYSEQQEGWPKTGAISLKLLMSVRRISAIKWDDID